MITKNRRVRFLTTGMSWASKWVPPPRKGEGNDPSLHPMFHVHEITYTIYPFRKLHSNLDSSYCCIGLFIVLLANPVRSYDSCFFTGFGTVSEAAIRYLKFSKDEK